MCTSLPLPHSIFPCQVQCVTQWLLSCAQLGFSFPFSESQLSSMCLKDTKSHSSYPKNLTFYFSDNIAT
ncbi:hypothetical protein BGY98DRAFT_183518 [Russula aff. rugulosa BPL654]|nr:hypothetical protein BGY98DRAFT_183518 [Russula aff. rugulosa BPL654]